MATHNDITGDALVTKVNSAAYRSNIDGIQKDDTPTPVFKVHECSNCHIKVSTSNSKCPLCGNLLT